MKRLTNVKRTYIETWKFRYTKIFIQAPLTNYPPISYPLSIFLYGFQFHYEVKKQYKRWENERKEKSNSVISAYFLLNVTPRILFPVTQPESLLVFSSPLQQTFNLNYVQIMGAISWFHTNISLYFKLF